MKYLIALMLFFSATAHANVQEAQIRSKCNTIRSEWPKIRRAIDMRAFSNEEAWMAVGAYNDAGRFCAYPNIGYTKEQLERLGQDAKTIKTLASPGFR